MILEAIILLAILMVALSVGLLLLKVVFAVVLLPLKLAFFLTKGLFGLLIVLPLLLVIGTVFLAVVPVGAALLFLPVLVFGGLVAKLAGS